jgi:hypothetical protein
MTSVAPRFLDIAVVNRLPKKESRAGFVETQARSELGEGGKSCGQSRVVKRHVVANSVEHRYGRVGRGHVRECSLRRAQPQPRRTPSSRGRGVGR